MSWFRLPVDIVNDPAVQGLPPEQFKIWVNLLCLTNLCKGGRLPTKVADIAFYIRETELVTAQAIEALLSAGLLERDADGRLRPSNWEQYQPSSLRPDAAEWRVIRERIFRRDDYTCVYCNTRGGKLHCDHIFPVARGGGHEDENLVTSCEPCNRAKRSKIVSVDEWRAVRGGNK